MSLKVQVNYPRQSRQFHGGDRITGTVTAVGPINDDKTTVTIKLKGKSQTMIRVSTGQSMLFYNDKAKFFSISKVLLCGPCRLAAGASESWSFDFDLPRKTEPTQGNAGIQPSAESFTPFAKRAHDLPPPMSVERTLGRKKVRAQISYTLTATAARSALFSRTLKETCSLPFGQYRPQSASGTPAPNPQMTSARCRFEHASSKLKAPELVQQHRKMGEWLGDKFTSQAPSAVFSLSARTPTVLIVDQPEIPVQLTLHYDSATSTAPVVPDIKVIAIEYRLKHYTQVRAPNSFGRDQTVEPSGFAYTRQLTFGPSASLLTDGETIDLGLSAGLSLEGRGVVPTFDSYNICRYYAVTLTVTVDVIGKQMTEKFKWKPVLVLPKEDGDERATAGPSSARERLRDVTEMVAPPYVQRLPAGGELPPAYGNVDQGMVAPNEKSGGGVAVNEKSVGGP